MDISKTIEPKSDQQNYDDYLNGPKTVTITDAKQGPPDQPVHLHLAEFPGRPYKPGKSMRRVLIAAWGTEASVYIGRSMTLYGDPEVRFGGQAVGGIRISHLSHLDKPLTVALTVTRGKREPFVVQPLKTAGTANNATLAAVDESLAEIAASSSMPALQVAWQLAEKRGVAGHPDVKAAKDKRKVELSTPETLIPEGQEA